MTFTLYRVTDLADTINTIPADEKIEFSTDLNVKIPNAFLSTYDIPTTIGIGNNQAAEEDLGDHQDLGPVENMYTLRGFISQRDKIADGITIGSNPFIAIMKKWDEENKTNASFKHGRMGVKIDDMVDYSVPPVGSPSATQKGLIWKGIYWSMDYEQNPLRANFEIQMIVDKGDDL